MTVHSSEANDAWRSRWIDGNATFTTVLSSISMNSAKHIAPSVHHLLFSSVTRRWRWARTRSVMRRGPPGVGSMRRECPRLRSCGGGFQAAASDVLALEQLRKRRGQRPSFAAGQGLGELDDPA